METTPANYAPLTAEEKERVNTLLRKSDCVSFDDIPLLKRDGWTTERGNDNSLSRRWQLEREGNYVLDFWPGRGVVYLIYKRGSSDELKHAATIDELRVQTREASAKVE